MCQNPSFASKLYCYNPQKTSDQASGWGGERNSEIVEISNRYKHTFDKFIHNSDSESSFGTIDDRFCNTPRSGGGLISFLEKNCLKKNLSVSNMSLQLAHKTFNNFLYQRCEVAIFGLKIRSL